MIVQYRSGLIDRKTWVINDGVDEHFWQQNVNSLHIKQLLHPVYLMQQCYDIYNYITTVSVENFEGKTFVVFQFWFRS